MTKNGYQKFDYNRIAFDLWHHCMCEWYRGDSREWDSRESKKIKNQQRR